jgi:ferritin-like metal-binding protein YciE
MLGTVKDLRELFELELRYAYDCEKKLTEKGLPTMIDKAHSPDLQAGLRQHLTETQGHVRRLERIFSAVGVKPDTKDNAVLDKMMDAAKDSASNIDDAALRDLALTVNGNFVEHYEIALYGSLIEFAQRLGLSDAVSLLNESLREEKAADAKLTEIGRTIAPTVARHAAP